MKTMAELELKLQKAGRKQASLYLFCNFVSLMLVTAYSAIIFSPTVLTVFPEGGDSRKQLYAVFVLALFGCVVFTIYASSLFFRKKSRQLGILMALGASRRRLAPGLFREVLFLSGISSLAGILAGFPFVLLLWNGFRLFIVDTTEMALVLDFRCLLVPVPFFILVAACACLLAAMYLKRTNILDVVTEEHKNEPVREPGRWCGPVGIILLLAGAVTGYYSETVYEAVFKAYGPSWLNITYAPVFVGLYMIMLHTVVHGWTTRRKHPYKNIISRSMMKFQGKQTVNSLLVSTVLIAGGCFAIFYIPLLGTGRIMSVNSRTYDYVYHYRADQNVPGQQEVAALARRYDVPLKDWNACPYISLGLDGYTRIEEDGGAFHDEYMKALTEGKFLSETSFQRISGQKVDVAPGSYYAVTNDEETGTYWLSLSSTQLTNMVTKAVLPTKFAGCLHMGVLEDKTGYYVLDDKDYEAAAQGLTPEWMGNVVLFNVRGEDKYEFAKALLHDIVDSTGPECAYAFGYDRVAKAAAEERGERYYGDDEPSYHLSYDNPDASDFRLNWTYMPVFRILDLHDFMSTFSVFLMAFLFVSIVCFLAALVISYTRCQTIALNNRYIFEDLKRLGASPAFLSKEVRRQCSIVFQIPAVTGIAAMTVLYSLILYANDGRFTSGELAGLVVCLGVLVLVAALFFGIYCHTVQRLNRELEIKN